MKKLLLIVMALVLVAAGATAQETKESRAARKAKMAKDIELLMTNSHFGGQRGLSAWPLTDSH